MFDVQKFMGTKYISRTEDIPVPDLKDFFPEGETPAITIRGLTGEELALVYEHVDKYRNTAKIIEGLLSPDQKEKLAAVKESLGLGDKVPDDLVKRLKMLTLGSVSPQIAQDQAVKLAKVFPIEFYTLTISIIRLTGMGSLPGESKPSINVPISEQV